MYSKELKDYLINNGASQVGFANLSELGINNMNSGISILLTIPKETIKSISNGPNIEYYDQYSLLNIKLNNLAELGTQYIKSLGYEAIAQTTDFVKEYGNYRTSLPHKTVATISGLGWIGKSALFVTKEYGSAIRLTSIITNIDLDYGIPIRKSNCGDCTRCVDACPGEAIKGKLWNAEIDRDDFFDSLKCRTKARQLAKERFNKEITLCGKCIEICPHTKGYINR